MAVSFVASAVTPAGGHTTTAPLAITSPALPSGTSTGDRVYLIVANTPTDQNVFTQPTTPSGWTVGGSELVGVNVALGTGVGQRQITMFYRDKDTSWSTIPNTSIASGSNHSAAAHAITLRKGAGEEWTVPQFTSGSDPAFVRSLTVTHGSITTYSAGAVIVGTVKARAATATSPTLTQAGATFADLTERGDGATQTGWDIGLSSYSALVTVGATAPTDSSEALNTQSTGGGAILSQGVSAAPMSTPPVVDAGPDATITLGETFTRTGVQTSGSPADYFEWYLLGDKGAEYLSGEATVSWTPQAAGTYTLELYGGSYTTATGADQVIVTVVQATAPVEAATSTTWTAQQSVDASTGTTWPIRTEASSAQATSWTAGIPVEASADESYEIRTTAASSTAETWTVTGTAVASRQTAYDVQAGVEGTGTAAWSVRTSAGSSAGATWAVRQGVSTSAAGSWAVLGALSGATAGSWSVAGSVEQQTATDYTVRAGVESSSSTSYEVISFDAVSTSTGTTWSARAGVLEDQAATFDIAVPVSDERDTGFAVRAAVESSRGSTYEVLAALGTVASSRAASYSVRAITAASGAGAWTTYRAVAIDRGATWRAAVAILRDGPVATWDELAAASATSSTGFAVLARVDAEQSAEWAAFLPNQAVSADCATSWGVAQPRYTVTVATMLAATSAYASVGGEGARVTLPGSTTVATVGGGSARITLA